MYTFDGPHVFFRNVLITEMLRNTQDTKRKLHIVFVDV